MNEQVSFTLRGRNPDVLTCIANLSNDEVFTPPELAGRMLDMLAEAWGQDHGGADLWADKTVRFLDPFTKSGVFLREITSRLTEGLALQMPDLQERVNHILTRQVFEMSPNKILHDITLEAVSGGVAERRAWLEDSGHFRVGDLARMTIEERERVVDEMLGEN